MAFGLYEFPHTDFYDSDLSELLKFNKILVDDYNEIVQRIKNAEEKYDHAFRYIANRNKWFSEQNDNLKKLFIKYTLMVQDESRRMLQIFEGKVQDLEKFGETVAQWKEEIFKDNQKVLENAIENKTDFIVRFNEALVQARVLTEETYNRLNDSIKTNFEDIGAFVQELVDALESAERNVGVQELIDKVDESYDRVVEMMKIQLKIWDESQDQKVDEALDEIREEFDSRIKNHEDYVNKSLKRLAELQIELFKDQMTFTNPVTYQEQNIQQILNSMWRWTRAWSLTVEQWENLPYTVEEIEEFEQNPTRVWEKGLTVQDGECLARWILVEKPDTIERAQSVRLDLQTYKDEMLQYVEDEWDPKFWLATASIQQNAMTYIDYLHDEHVKQVDEMLDEVRDLVADDFSAKVIEILRKQNDDWNKLLQVTKRLAERSN